MDGLVFNGFQSAEHKDGPLPPGPFIAAVFTPFFKDTMEVYVCLLYCMLYMYVWMCLCIVCMCAVYMMEVYVCRNCM